MVSYIRYRKRSPEQHHASQFKMPFSKVAPWCVLAFFAFIAFALAMGEDTRVALILTPIWFIILGILWKVTKSRLQRENLPLTGAIEVQSPEEIARNFREK